MSFWSISRPRPQNGPRKLPEGRFGAFPSPGRRMGPGSLQKSFYDIFCYPRRGRTHIYDIFCYPKSGRTHIYDIFCYPKRGRFGAFPSLGRRMGPGSLQKAILEHFQAQAAE